MALELEQYLIDDYGIITHQNLKTEDDIEGHFELNGRILFDCGQGYFEDYAQVTVATEDGRFFAVEVDASIDHSGQVYFVESIECVRHREIPKPTPKPREEVRYRLMLTKEQEEQMDEFAASLPGALSSFDSIDDDSDGDAFDRAREVALQGKIDELKRDVDEISDVANNIFKSNGKLRGLLKKFTEENNELLDEIHELKSQNGG